MVDLTDSEICAVIRAERKDAEGPLRAEIERLRAAIRWACGEEPDSEGRWFGEHEPPQKLGSRPRPYWWRTPLRKLSGIDEQTEDGNV